MINLGVIFGGKSVEHDISIITYFQALNSIDRKKYNIYPLYLDKNNQMSISKEYFKLETFKEKKKVKKYDVNLVNKNNGCYIKKYYSGIFIRKIKIDCILVVVHGKGLEDGTISGYLDILNVPYTCLNSRDSSILHDKYNLKIYLNSLGINVLPSKLIYKKVNFNIFEESSIIKCSSLGSSIGVYNVDSQEEFDEKINICFKYDDRVIVEKKLNDFVEYNQAVYMKGEEIVLSEIEKVYNHNNLYGFDEKYNNREIVKSLEIEEDIKQEINRITEKIAKEFNITTVVRIDYLYDLENNKIYVNEVNVIPGGLSYYLYEEKGIFFKDLINDLVDNAFRNHYLKNEKISYFKSSVLNNCSKMKYK